MNGRPFIVILAGGMWRERWTTYQRIARELAKNARILYVEGNYSIGKLFKGLFRRRPYPVTLFGRLRTENENFHVLTPPPRLAFRHWFRPIGLLNQWILGRCVRRAARTLGIRDPILWSFLHQTDRLIGRMGERYAVYHCVDYWPWLTPTVFLLGRRERIEKDEALTAAKAAFTVSTSRFLARRLSTVNPASHHVPNAADLDLFAEDAKADAEPADMKAISGPVLGFSGTLEAKTNLDLLRRIADERPDWNLVLIGRTKNVPDLGRIQRVANVHILGLKPRESLPAYFRRFDVCLVPFRRSEELESISPLKIFEYLAAGRPVVATRYGEIEGLGEAVYLSDTDDEFVANLSLALQEDGPERRARRREVAAENTWERRGEALAALIEGFEQKLADPTRPGRDPGRKTKRKGGSPEPGESETGGS